MSSSYNAVVLFRPRSSARSSVNYNTPDGGHKTTNDLGRYQQNILSQSGRLLPRSKHVETTEL